MHVLINGMQGGNQSGTGRYTEELIRHLAARPDEVHLTVWWPGGVPAGDWADAVELIRQPRGVWARLKLERHIQRIASEYDVVHYPASIGPLDGGPNVVVTVHDCIFMRHPDWFRWERAEYYRWAGTRSARRAGRVIADSEATAHDLRELIGVPNSRIDVVPLGVGGAFRPQTQAACDAVRDRYKLPESFFLYVGTLEPRKNLAALVRAWDSIAGDIEEELVIAGRTGWKTEEMLAAIGDAKHQDRVHLPGFLEEEDLVPAIGAARAFVWPSLFEGFGLPVLEAMACGTPVLTSNLSSLPEVAGDAALLVDPENESDIAEGLKRLSTDDVLRARLSAAGIQRASEFTWARTADLTLKAYERLARGAVAG
jgi:glycosyltransferase involved in cell wall biosynthesis